MNNLIKGMFVRADVLFAARFTIFDTCDEVTSDTTTASTLPEAQKLFKDLEPKGNGTRFLIALDQYGDQFGANLDEKAIVAPASHEPYDAAPLKAEAETA